MITKLWVSSLKFTEQVDVADGEVILMTPPIWKKFVGQPLENLVGWLTKFGKVEVEAL